MNAYQIIPGIMYTLLARLWGVVRATILNEAAAIKAINFVARYIAMQREHNRSSQFMDHVLNMSSNQNYT